MADGLLGSRTEQYARLVVALIVDLAAVGHHLAQLIIHELWINGLLQPTAELKLTDCADHAQVEEHELGVVEEISRVEVLVRDVTHPDGHELAIDSVVEVVRPHRLRTVTLVFKCVKSFVDFGSSEEHACLGELRLLVGVIQWAVAKESLELLGWAVALVDVLFIASVELVEFVGEHGAMQVNRVLMHGDRHELTINVTVIKELVDVVLVKVRITTAVVALGLCLRVGFGLLQV